MSFSCRTQSPVMTGGGVPRRKRHYGPGIEVGYEAFLLHRWNISVLSYVSLSTAYLHHTNCVSAV